LPPSVGDRALSKTGADAFSSKNDDERGANARMSRADLGHGPFRDAGVVSNARQMLRGYEALLPALANPPSRVLAAMFTFGSLLGVPFLVGAVGAVVAAAGSDIGWIFVLSPSSS
jgi:hypothetical protein